jgi:DNA-binding NtrC family response regulator
MEEPGILIADKDTEFLREVEESFTCAGYRVETTDSAVHVICNILKKNIPVVLLGSDFDKKINPLQLLQLLKKCNRHLAVILVSDEASLPQVRTVCSEKVLYQVLRPVSTPE